MASTSKAYYLFCSHLERDVYSFYSRTFVFRLLVIQLMMTMTMLGVLRPATFVHTVG